jgi:hypothetical protein
MDTIDLTSAAPPEAVSRLIRLFEAHSDILRFPGVDAKLLNAAVKEVEAQAAVVSQMLEQVQLARAELVKKQEHLLERAKMGHAYAAIYAKAEPALQAELSQIELDVAEAPARKRKPRLAAESASAVESAAAAESTAAE